MASASARHVFGGAGVAAAAPVGVAGAVVGVAALGATPAAGGRGQRRRQDEGQRASSSKDRHRPSLAHGRWGDKPPAGDVLERALTDLGWRTTVQESRP